MADSSESTLVGVMLANGVSLTSLAESPDLLEFRNAADGFLVTRASGVNAKLVAVFVFSASGLALVAVPVFFKDVVRLSGGLFRVLKSKESIIKCQSLLRINSLDHFVSFHYLLDNSFLGFHGGLLDRYFLSNDLLGYGLFNLSNFLLGVRRSFFGLSLGELSGFLGGGNFLVERGKFLSVSVIKLLCGSDLLSVSGGSLCFGLLLGGNLSFESLDGGSGLLLRLSKLLLLFFR